MQEPDANPRSDNTINPERWVDDHGDFLFRYAMVRVRNTALAKDLVQDTLLAALRGREKFAGRSSERGWLSGILKHKIMDHYRKLGRETSFTDLEFLADEFSEKFVQGWWIHREGPMNWKPDAEVVVHREEFWTVLRDCLGRLPNRIANVFLLREMEGISTKEICKSLTITESNLWVMLHRGRMALRECLELTEKGSRIRGTVATVPAGPHPPYAIIRIGFLEGLRSESRKAAWSPLALEHT